MKKLLLTAALLVAAFTGRAQSVVEAISGNYTGDLYISFAPINDATEPIAGQRVTLAAGEAEGTVSLSLFDFQFNDVPMGDIVVPAVPVSENADGSIAFGENEPVSLVLGGFIEATAGINPETSHISGGILTADIDVLWTNSGGDAPVPIYVRFVSDGTSGIDGVTVQPAKAARGIYTISGRRVNATSTTALPAGLYIVDGKKTLVK